MTASTKKPPRLPRGRRRAEFDPGDVQRPTKMRPSMRRGDPLKEILTLLATGSWTLRGVHRHEDMVHVEIYDTEAAEPGHLHIPAAHWDSSPLAGDPAWGRIEAAPLEVAPQQT